MLLVTSHYVAISDVWSRIMRRGLVRVAASHPRRDGKLGSNIVEFCCSPDIFAAVSIVRFGQFIDPAAQRFSRRDLELVAEVFTQGLL